MRQSIQQALDALKAGNERFAQGMNQKEKSIIALREKLIKGQEPYAAVLTCSDSRVAPEVVFDTCLGELFVIRVAGNVLEPLGLTTLELAIAELHIPVIVVMGHSQCKAVSTAMEGVPEESYLFPLVQGIALGGNVPEGRSKQEQMISCVKHNAVYQAKEIVRRSSIVREATKKGLKICPSYYDFFSGYVHWLSA